MRQCDGEIETRLRTSIAQPRCRRRARWRERHPEPKPLLDDGARLGAIAVEQKSQQIEADAAGDERQPDEHPEIIAGEARGDRDDFVGDRRQALEQDDPGPPLRVGGAERLDLVAIAVELDQPVPDGIVEQRADRIAEHASGDRREGADMRVEPGPIRPRQRHRDQHRVRRGSERSSFPETR